MSAYFVFELEITNMDAMAPYREAVGATLAQYGGRFLVRVGATELIEGGPEPKRIVILEFADAAACKRWYNSPQYQKILPNRLENSKARAFIVDGVSSVRDHGFDAAGIVDRPWPPKAAREYSKGRRSLLGRLAKTPQ